MISPEARERLASRMDDRRLELSLRWRDVAEAGGISYEALRDVRNGTRGIRRLTEHAIEVALKWESGSVQRILDGGEPIPAGGEPAPVTATGGITLPPLAVTGDAGSGDDVTTAVVAALFGSKERRIWAQVRRRLAERTPAGAALFADPAQSAAWPPESPDGSRGGAPFDLTPQARELLDIKVTPAEVLFDRMPEIVVWRLDEMPFRKRVEMIREYREPVRGAGIARRAGLKKPSTLSALSS